MTKRNLLFSFIAMSASVWSGQPSLVPPHLGPSCESSVDVGPQNGVAPAIHSSSYTLNSLTFETRYFRQQISGELHAYLEKPGKEQNLLFEGSEKMGEVSASDRVVMSSQSGAGIPFRWVSLNEAQRALLKDGQSDAAGADRLEYLRGDQSLEILQGSTFRRRPDRKPMGPIVNSIPWYVGAPDAAFPGPQPAGYASYRAANFKRRGVVYVAANDGMLHGFDAENGNLLLSYLPDYLLRRVAATTASHFQMTALFDGMPFAGDVNLGTTTLPQWRTVLFAPFGRGGHGIVALDVTNPGTTPDRRSLNDFIGSEANAANAVKWEFTDKNDREMGNIISRPQKNQHGGARQVVQLQDGRWVVLTGNGFNSEAADENPGSGDAVLFMLNVRGPTGPGNTWLPLDYLKVSTRNVDGQIYGAGPGNGLGSPFSIDTNGDGKVDLIYAADYKGNIWKFVDKLKNGSWAVAFGVPLYTAESGDGAEQPVSAALTVRKHPRGGYMVLFGTGKFVEPVDAYPTGTFQSIYGIWDRETTVTGLSGRARLLRQGVEFTSPDGKYRLTSDKKITDWTGYDGWYLDLPVADEKIIDNLSLRSGGVVAFNTVYIKRSVSGNCIVERAGFAMTVDALDGSAASALEINTEGAMDDGNQLSVAVDHAGRIVGLIPSGGAVPTGGRLVKKRPSGIRISQSSGFSTDQKTVSGVKRYLRVDCSADGAIQGPDGYCRAHASESSTARVGRINWREVLRNQ